MVQPTQKTNKQIIQPFYNRARLIYNTIYLENIFKTFESIENNEYDIHTHMYSRCK